MRTLTEAEFETTTGEYKDGGKIYRKTKIAEIRMVQ